MRIYVSVSFYSFFSFFFTLPPFLLYLVLWLKVSSLSGLFFSIIEHTFSYINHVSLVLLHSAMLAIWFFAWRFHVLLWQFVETMFCSNTIYKECRVTNYKSQLYVMQACSIYVLFKKKMKECRKYKSLSENYMRS